MACMKCGSDWVTTRGKNMVSCPECCRQQRCKARKQGRLPAEESKRCERCGCEFTASGANAMARSRHCSACSELARQDYLQARKDKIKSGEWKTKPQGKLKGRKCCSCEKRLKAGQRKYCSRDCFFASRKSGVQEWNRASNFEASTTRSVINGGYPSRRALSKLLNGFSGFMAKLRAFQKKINRLHCLACDGFVDRESSRFCSEACARQFEFSTSCARCGCSTTAKGHRGPKRRVCDLCREEVEMESRRKGRRKYGRNHRQRARHHGVAYVSFPVRDIYERDGYRCQICKRRVFEKARYRKSDGKIHPLSPTIDHIVPMSKGGNHEPDNCQTACFMCNSRKSDSSGGQLRLAIAATPTE